ncbi:MAG: hypothetical protein SPI30_08555 [Prevotella sp.]|nr:hypothetical protein [Prevotella sp.]
MTLMLNCRPVATNDWYCPYQALVATVPTAGTVTTKHWYDWHTTSWMRHCDNKSLCFHAFLNPN